MQLKNHINTNSFHRLGVIMNALREMFYIFYTFRCINLIRIIFTTSASIDDFWMILCFIVMRHSVTDVKAFAMHQPR